MRDELVLHESDIRSCWEWVNLLVGVGFIGAKSGI